MISNKSPENKFKSASLGAIQTPVNILKEFLKIWRKMQKCKAAILSYFDSKRHYYDWYRATYQQIAEDLGYCAETISKHMKELVGDGLLLSKPAHWFPKDTANEYQINTEKITEYVDLGQSEKFEVDTRNNSTASSRNPRTYKINKKNIKKLSLKRETENFSEGKEDKDKLPEMKPYPWNENDPPVIFPKRSDNSSSKESPKSSDRPKKQTKRKRIEKYIWEEEIDFPNPLFVRWWANKHYKPQGGRWESGMFAHAQSEFYNNPSKAANAIFPSFIEEMKRVVKTCEQVQRGNQKATVPSWFLPQEEITEEVLRSLRERYLGVFEAGAEIRLPANHPSSFESVSLEDLGDRAPVIVPGVNLIKPEEFMVEYSQYSALWIYEPQRREEVRVWAREHAGRVEIDEDLGVIFIE